MRIEKGCGTGTEQEVIQRDAHLESNLHRHMQIDQRGIGSGIAALVGRPANLPKVRDSLRITRAPIIGACYF